MAATCNINKLMVLFQKKKTKGINKSISTRNKSGNFFLLDFQQNQIPLRLGS